jgi:hypothetical protein
LQTFGAVAFPSFKAGFDTLKEVGLAGCFPASIRLMDNEQFKLANALKVKALLLISSLPLTFYPSAPFAPTHPHRLHACVRFARLARLARFAHHHSSSHTFHILTYYTQYCVMN